MHILIIYADALFVYKYIYFVKIYTRALKTCAKCLLRNNCNRRENLCRILLNFFSPFIKSLIWIDIFILSPCILLNLFCPYDKGLLHYRIVQYYTITLVLPCERLNSNLIPLLRSHDQPRGIYCRGDDLWLTESSVNINWISRRFCEY